VPTSTATRTRRRCGPAQPVDVVNDIEAAATERACRRSDPRRRAGAARLPAHRRPQGRGELADLQRGGPGPGNPDRSPDGRRIVFNSSFDGQAAVELYTVRPDGEGLRRLRRERERSFSFEPVWSPDGGRIAFVHATSRTPPHIWTMRRNGDDMRQLMHGPSPTCDPTGVALTTTVPLHRRAIHDEEPRPRARCVLAGHGRGPMTLAK
jgi:hypothetical protein